MKEVEEGKRKNWEEWEVGGRDKGWEEHKAERKDGRMEECTNRAERRWRMYIYILYT